MLKEVRNARRPARFIGRANAIPDHVRDHRRAAIGNHHDLQAIPQCESLWPRQLTRVGVHHERKHYRARRNCGAKACRQQSP
jgi:hypothetical protein